jgi:P-type conjugative transfer protein VirB9
MNKIIGFSLAWCVGTSSAFAVDVPTSSKHDNRIQYVTYNPGTVVLVRALPGLGARIVFGADEKILDVASGFSQGWEFSDRRNILYVKPKSVKQGNQILIPKPGDWNTNLMVTTDRRMYDFDLQLLSGGGNRSKPPVNQNVAYRIEFQYPSDAQAEAQAEAVQSRINRAPPPANWRYSMQIGDNSENIAPTMAYDDGRFTYLRFPANREFPAAFLVSADKSESLVNSHIDPAASDVLVIHRVSPAIVLRLGSAVVGIYNEAYDSNGVPPTHGTTVPGVQRIIKSGKK